MVILIGGSSHVGKTLIAQKLMEAYKYPYLSLDHLKMGLIRSGLTTLTVEDDYEMRYFMWSTVVGIIKTAIENEQNLIIEGCYIPGEWQDSFTKEYLDNIRCVFIVMSEKYIRDRFDRIVAFANVIERRLDDHPDPERLIVCSRDFKQECLSHGVPYYEIDGEYRTEKIIRDVQNVLGL